MDQKAYILKAVNKFQCLALIFIFLMAACMHLFYSPHHQDLLNCYPAGLSCKGAPLDFATLNAHQKNQAGIFPEDFELGEAQLLLKAHQVEMLSDLVVFMKLPYRRHYLFLLGDARASPAARPI
jgi:hypothetical protein